MDERSIEVVIDAFIIVIGVAVERFITEFPLGEDKAFDFLKTLPHKRRYRRPHRTWKVKVRRLRYRISQFRNKSYYLGSYGSSLAVIVTLVLRFLLGSDLHLRNAYLHNAGKQNINQFAVDIAVLMFFGTCIVGAALAESIQRFAWWLALCSAAGALWSWQALSRPDVQDLRDLVRWWFQINSVQCGIAFCLGVVCWYLGKSRSRKLFFWRFKKPETKQKIMIWGVVILALWYLAIFPFDLGKIFKEQKEVPPAFECLVQTISPFTP